VRLIEAAPPSLVRHTLQPITNRAERRRPAGTWFGPITGEQAVRHFGAKNVAAFSKKRVWAVVWSLQSVPQPSTSTACRDSPSLVVKTPLTVPTDLLAIRD
jgi:hypothetical protein